MRFEKADIYLWRKSTLIALNFWRRTLKNAERAPRPTLRRAKMHGFSAGRRPKPKIVKTTTQDEDEEVQDLTSGTESMEIEPPAVPAIKRINRPALNKKSSGSKLKLSFGAEEEVDDDQPFIPKRSNLSKQVTESKGRKFGLQAYLSIILKTNSSDALPTTPSDSATLASRPTYTKEYLSQLRDSTPSTPKDISRYLSDNTPDSETSAPATTARPAEILDEAVIRALKERRRDRARGEDYMSLEETGTKTKSRRRDSDDDEMYRTYVDEAVPLQKNMEAAQKAHKKSQIQEALYISDSDAMSDVDEDEWENQQIAKTAPALVKRGKRELYPMPSEIPPPPTVAGAMTRLQEQLAKMKTRRAELVEVVTQLEKEAEEIREREEAVQESLTKAGKEYDMLREEFK